MHCVLQPNIGASSERTINGRQLLVQDDNILPGDSVSRGSGEERSYKKGKRDLNEPRLRVFLYLGRMDVQTKYRGEIAPQREWIPSTF